MPVYSIEGKGLDKTRIIKAPSAAKARDHVVSAKPLSAEELVELIAKGAEIEQVSEGETSTETQD